MFSSPITRFYYGLCAAKRRQGHNTNKNNHLSIKKHKKFHCLIYKEYLTDTDPVAAGRIAKFADPWLIYYRQDKVQFLFKFLDDLPIK